MKNFLFFITVLFTSSLFAQSQGSIKGFVTDEAMNNEPLLMANIQIKGESTTTQSNFHGNYEISDLKPGKYTLVMSYLGYENKEVIVDVKENTITRLHTQLSPIQITIANIAANMDSALKEGTKE